MLIAYACLFGHRSEHSSVAVQPKSLIQVKVIVFSPEAHRLLRQEKNVMPLLMNKSHMLYEQEKREKTLPDSSSPDRTRLSALSLSKRRRKMSPFALQREEKPPYLKAHKETVPRISGTSCHWG